MQKVVPAWLKFSAEARQDNYNCTSGQRASHFCARNLRAFGRHSHKNDSGYKQS